MSRETVESRINVLMAPSKIATVDGILPEDQFHKMVRLERKRAKRSAKPFLLIHLDVTRLLGDGDAKARRKVLETLVSATRGTDIIGWSKRETVIGMMFIEVGEEVNSTVMATMLVRVSDALRNILALEQFRRVDISFQRFPEQVDELAMPQLVPQLFALAGSE